MERLLGSYFNEIDFGLTVIDISFANFLLE